MDSTATKPIHTNFHLGSLSTNGVTRMRAKDSGENGVASGRSDGTLTLKRPFLPRFLENGRSHPRSHHTETSPAHRDSRTQKGVFIMKTFKVKTAERNIRERVQLSPAIGQISDLDMQCDAVEAILLLNSYAWCGSEQAYSMLYDGILKCATLTKRPWRS